MELTISEPLIAPPYSRLAPDYDVAIGFRSFTGTRAAFERLIRRYAAFHLPAPLISVAGQDFSLPT